MKKHLLFALALISVVLTGTLRASAADAGPYTSNVELKTDGGTNAWNDIEAIIDEASYNTIKMGTAKAGGTWLLTVPAGTTELSFYAVSWKGKSCKLSIEGGNATPASIDLVANEGVSGNGPFTIVPAATDYYTVALSGITADTELTFTTDQRCVIWGVNVKEAEAPNHDPVVLIKDASQLSSNASDSAEGKNIGALIDGNVTTFWHTDWHGVCTDQYHYLQVDLNVSYEGYLLLDITRRDAGNDHPSKFLVQGSNDGENFTDICTLAVPFAGSSTSEKVTFEVPSVQYLRFNTIDCGGGAGYRKYWHASEFQLSSVDDYYVARLNLEQILIASENAYYKNFSLQTSDSKSPWYLWSNAPDKTEGQHPEYLLDGNAGTFFHSDWHGDVKDTHYMAIDCGEGNSINAFVLQYTRRMNNNNNRPTEIEIQGSNDGENYTTFRTLTAEADGLPTDQSVNNYISDVIECGADYRHVRFMINKTNNNSLFFTFSEFSISSVDAKLKAKLADIFAKAQAVLADPYATAADLDAVADRTVEIVATSDVELAPGKYFLRNKANGKYISNGAYWGTRATFTNNYGFEFNVTANENGTYKLGTFVNEGKSLRDSDGYSDQDGSWTIEATDQYNTFTLKGSAGYLGSDGSDYVAVNLADGSTEAAQWEIVTKDMLLADALAADASYDNPVDFSFLITGRSFCSHGSADNASWTPDAPGIGGAGGSGNKILNSHCGEFWNKGAVTASQTFTGLPDGYYQFNAFAYYRMGGPVDHADHMQADDLKANAFIFVNDTKKAVKFVSDDAKEAAATGWDKAYTTTDGNVMMYGPDQLSQAVAAFAAGAYKNSVIAHVVGGKLTLGFGKDDSVPFDWFVFDEAQLFYLGNTPNEKVEAGNYYLYNKESGKFLSRGAAWGTQICLDNYGYAFNVSNDADAYILKVIDWQENGMNVSLLNGSDGGSYVDNGSTTENKHSFKAVEGGYKISNNANGEYWIVNDPTVNGGIGPHGTEAQALVFDFLTPNEYETLIAERWAAEKLAAAQQAGVAQTAEALADTLANWSRVDETSKVKSASLMDSRDGWTWTGGRYRGGSLATNENGTECYNGTGTLYQKIEGLEPGFYLVTLNGFYRSMGDRVACYNYSKQNIHLSSAYVMANGNVTRIKAVGDDAELRDNTIYPNWMNESKDCFAKGLYLNEVYTYVGADGVLEITIGQPSWKGECWLMMNNVTLTRFVADPYAALRSALTSAAKYDVEIDPMDAAVAAEFKAAVAQGQLDLDKNVDAVSADAERINSAIAAVKTSVAFYEAAANEFAHEANFYAEGLIGAAAFNEALTATQKSYFDRKLTAEEITALQAVFNSYVATNVTNAGVEMGQLINGTFGDASAATTDGWTYEGNSGTMGTGNHNKWVNINDAFVERWVSGPGNIEDFEFYQEVSGLPTGTYVISAYINATQQSNADDYMVKGVKFYAGSDAVDIHTFNVDRNDANRAQGAGQFFTAAKITAGETLKIGISVKSTDANWFLMDNVKIFNLDPNAALAVVIEKAKALIAENPDVNGEPLALLAAEINAANDIDGLSNAVDFFKSAIDVYTQFAALERQYDDVVLLADANKAAKAVLNSATIDFEQVAPAYEAYKQAIYEYSMATASVDTPVDVTALYVKNPTFNEGVAYWDTYSDVTGWGSPHAWQSQGASYSNGNIVIQQFIESWGSGNACGKSYALQTAELPDGFYKFSADIIATVQNAADTKGEVAGAYLVFADGKTAVATANGVPEHFEVYGTVTGGKATFGFNAESTTSNWICMDNVKLEYVGHQKVLGYFTLAGKTMAEGAEDPIYKMLAADPKFKVVLNEVAADFDGSLEDYDAIIVQESFGGADKALIDGVLSIGEVKRPMLFNKTYALGSRRGTADGTRADAQGDWFVTVKDDVNPIFKGIEGENVRVFYDGATDDGAAGTKGLTYVYGISEMPEGSLVAAPSTVDNASVAINDIHADSKIGGKTTQARVITFGMNYGAICREGGKYMTDEAFTMWRNAAYMLLGLEVPAEPVDMDVNDICETSGVSLDVTAAEVGEDQAITLTATVTPETAADKSLVWTSSDENIATVVNGVVTGINMGECDITVATVDGGFTASCHITVFRTRFFTYDFRQWSEETQTNMAADAKKKTNWQKLGSYYKNTSALSEAGMTTVDGDIEEAKGLLFNIGGGNLRVYYGEAEADNYILFFAAGSVIVPTELYDQVTVCIDGVQTTYTSAGTTFVLDIEKGAKLNWIQVDPCGEGIEGAAADSDVISSAIYSVDGKKVAEPVKGINIVKKMHADGTVTSEKVLVK